MRKIFKNHMVFFLTVLSLLIFATSGECKKRYFDESAYGNIMDTTPDRQQCIDGVEKCVMQTCKSNSPYLGAYDRCDSISTTKVISFVEACLNGISYADKVQYLPQCSNYVMPKISEFLQQKDEINQFYETSTPSCLNAKKMLSSAQNCLSYVSKNKESSRFFTAVSLENICGKSAGGSDFIVSDFLTAIANNAPLESVLSTYIILSNQSCSQGDYELPKIIDGKKQQIMRLNFND